AGAGSAVRASVCLSRRRAAGGTPHPGGDEPALAGARRRGRTRPARSGSDRARAAGSVARCGQCRRIGRRALVARRHERTGGACPTPSARARRAGLLHAPAATLWITAERLPQVQALWPGAQLEPTIAAPQEHAAKTWTREEALVELVRGRLEGQGPVTQGALA